MIEIKFKKFFDDVNIPEKKSKEAAGMDIHTYQKDGILLKKNEVHFIKTGFSMEIPQGYFADIRPRSGFSTKTKILIPNSPGTIDSDYRGEILIPLLNLSGEDYFLEHNTRIAQMIILECKEIKCTIVNELSNTERGNSGFGSTGKN